MYDTSAFNLKDVKKADVEKLEATKGVQGVVNKNGQFQVVIGSDVSHVCDEIRKLVAFDESIGAQPSEKTSLINRILGAITAIFQPVIPAICGAGMIKAVLAILTAASIVTTESQSYILLNMFADAAFYFLPIFLAFSSANVNCNPYFAFSARWYFNSSYVYGPGKCRRGSIFFRPADQISILWKRGSFLRS